MNKIINITFLSLILLNFNAVKSNAQTNSSFLPSQSRSFVVETVIRKPWIFFVDVPDANLQIGDINRTITYFDGLGRTKQTVSWKGSPDKAKDVVNFIDYDIYGRETKQYLPYASSSSEGSFKSSAVTEQRVFYSSPPAGVTSIAYPYAERKLEGSPLGRLLEQGAPGSAWQLSNSGIAGSGHTVKLEYTINKAADGPSVVHYIANPVTTGGQAQERTLVNVGNYVEGGLTVSIVKNENWTVADGKAGTTWEYKDKQGKIVLKRSWETAGMHLSTYYVYDLQGHLSFVLPPGALPDEGVISNDDMERYCYQYRYDGKNRLTEKKIPGKGWEWMVYDKRDLLLMSQDMVQRSTNIWLFNKYDEAGRIVVTGELNSVNDRMTMQTAVNSYSGAAWEKYTGANTYGYDNGSYPTSYNKVLVVNYYDRYDFIGNSFGQPTGTQRSDVLSFQTGSLVNVLGTTTMLLSVSYYDGKGRLVQKKDQNHLGGTDVSDMNYSFLDQLTASTRTHEANNVTTTIAETYIYDHMDRKIKTIQSINGATPVTLSELIYNELGQLVIKKLHNGLQSTAYTYNERGWMKKAESPEFSYDLKYDDGAVPQYNGNISNQNWGSGSAYPNTFTYSYDKLNRLTSGVSTGIAMSEELSYDRMGNIATLNRDGAGIGTYNYVGNRLNNISGGGLAVGDYSYDANGNATMDGRTGVALTYNYLSLPVIVSKSGLSLSYVYDALGNKLTKNSNGVVTQYLDGIQYKPDGTIDFIQTEVGIARRNGSEYNYEYTLADHLGNSRYSFDIYGDAPRRIQQQDYYAFGKVKDGQYVSGDKNQYLYNGKELQEELGQLDYGARFYDPVIGRWNVVDPLAESYLNFSPYNYVLNNPISNTDPDGMSVNTRYVTPDGKTIVNTDDGRDDVYEVPWSRVEEFKENAYWTDRAQGGLDGKGWNDYWRDQFPQTISEETINKAGINSLSDEKVKSAAVEYLYGSRSYQSFVWEEVKAQWRNPVNVAIGLTAFAHGMVGILQPKPSFGNTPEQVSHATRHILAKGLNVEAIKAAIAKDLGPASSYKAGVRITGTVIVNNVEVSYSGVKLPNGKINIGSIKPPR